MRIRFEKCLFVLAGVIGFVLAVDLLLAGIKPSPIKSSDDLQKIRQTLSKLKPIHKKLGKPEPGEWLAQHPEQGQTFLQYNRSRPVRFTAKRDKLYIQPLGNFSKQQKELVKSSSEYLACYFDCPVKILEAISLKEIPDSAQRIHPRWGDHQVLTSYVLEQLLAPNLPPDAAAMLAFSSLDLWPGDNWNFVFGQASLRNRVGVWSFYRHGKTDGTQDEYRTCLKRTIKVASHETGHMLSMNHCTAWKCNMQGSNSLPESDRHPLHLCPECHAKIMLATGCDPKARFRKLADYFKKNQMKREQEFCQQSLERIK